MSDIFKQEITIPTSPLRRRIYAFVILMVIVMLGSCARELVLSPDGKMYKGRKPYSGKIVHSYAPLQKESENWYRQGILVLEIHYDRNGDSSYMALYNSVGGLRQQKFWEKGVRSRRLDYDNYGHLLEEFRYGIYGGIEKRSQYRYDHYDNISLQKEFDGENRLTFQSEFNEEKEFLRVTYYSGGIMDREMIHEKGRLVNERSFYSGGGVKVQRNYGAEGRLQEVVHYRPEGSVEEFYRLVYTLDNKGRIQKVTVEDSRGNISVHKSVPNL